jgi:hypothetical protein
LGAGPLLENLIQISIGTAKMMFREVGDRKGNQEGTPSGTQIVTEKLSNRGNIIHRMKIFTR